MKDSFYVLNEKELINILHLCQSLSLAIDDVIMSRTVMKDSLDQPMREGCETMNDQGLEQDLDLLF